MRRGAAVQRAIGSRSGGRYRVR